MIIIIFDFLLKYFSFKFYQNYLFYLWNDNINLKYIFYIYLMKVFIELLSLVLSTYIQIALFL